MDKINKKSGQKTKRSEFGEFAEQMAVEHLMRKGYTVCERNWRPANTHLEVDIIAQKDFSTIVFVEVKARGKDGIDPVEAVDVAKQRKITRAADIYLRGRDNDYFYRFDIISVTGDKNDWTLEHIEDAFISPLFG